MKKLSVLIVLGLLLVGVTTVLADNATRVDSVPNLQIGDAAHYCVTTLGYDWGLKIEAWGGSVGGDPGKDGDFDGSYDGKGKLHEFYNNVITIFDSSRELFSWKSEPFKIDAVVVQGSTMDNIFYYEPPVTTDTELYPYDSEGNKRDYISQVNFCWIKEDENGDDECYQDETAWAAGLPYVPQGNWATYTPYDTDPAVKIDLLAGQTMDAGYVQFLDSDEEGWVDIKITLENGFIFYYDLADIEGDENIKVQDYEYPPLEKNPAIGHFDWKETAEFGSTEATITVPLNNYYGIHVDLAYIVDCETAE